MAITNISRQEAMKKHPFGEVEYLRNLLKEDFDFHGQTNNSGSHNFHSFPAKFPPQLPRKFINELTETGEIVLDPMVGSGTTTVEAFLLNRKSYGFDIDPLAITLAKVKTTQFDKHILLNSMKYIIRNSISRVSKSKDDLKSEISSFLGEETSEFVDNWFYKTTQGELFALSQEILRIDDENLRDFFKIAFSGIIITKTGGVSLALDLGHTRPHLAKKVVDKYGKVLIGNPGVSYPAHSTKILRLVFTEFEKKCLQNINGILSDKEYDCPPEIRFGDAQNLPIENNSIDLIVTSPPYASNAIDYMRAHKFSLVWFGYPIGQLGEKRKEYIGGEGVSNFAFEDLPAHSRSVIDKVSLIDHKKSLVLHRYYSEMTRVLREMYRVLKPGKSAIVVVGNSTIKGIDASIPYCLSEIGKKVGFASPSIAVRELDRNKRMLPVGKKINPDSQIQNRMHEEYIIGFIKV